MEYTSKKDIDLLLKTDAINLSSNPDNYIKNNRFGYYVLINTWCNIASEINPSGGEVLYSEILHAGLLPTITACDEEAAMIVNDVEGNKPMVRMIFGHQLSKVDLKTILEALRFPKRFSPVDADKLQADALQKFLRINNNIKMRDRRGYSQFFVSRVRDAMAILLDGYIEGGSPSNHGYFSTGAVFGAKKALAAKIASWDDPYYLDPMYPLTNGKTPYYRNLRRVDTSDSRGEGQLLPVPKNYKSARIIAKCTAYRQYYLQKIRKQMEDVLVLNSWLYFGEEFYNPKSQDRNQIMAYLASVSEGGYVTIDLSSASDSISVSLAREVFPLPVMHDLDNYRTEFVTVKNKPVITNMLATSGEGSCFVGETSFFMGCVLASYDIYLSWNQESTLLPPHLVGDDIIMDVNAFEILEAMFRNFGITVNMDKTFLTGNYAESCGVEFSDGYEVSTEYITRQEITATPEGMERLVSLSNRLWDNYPKACLFLKGVIKDTCQKHGWYFSTTSEFEYLDEGYCTDLIDYRTEYTKTFKERQLYHPSWDNLTKSEKLSKMRGCSLPKINEHAVRREYPCHMLFTSRHVAKSKVIDKFAMMDLEMYYYVEFLIHGPVYQDSLSKLLNVSSSIRRDDHLYSYSEVIITTDNGVYTR